VCIASFNCLCLYAFYTCDTDVTELDKWGRKKGRGSALSATKVGGCCPLCPSSPTPLILTRLPHTCRPLTFTHNASHWISLVLRIIKLFSPTCRYANYCTLTCPCANMNVPTHFNHPTTHMASLCNCPSLYIIMLPFLIPSSQTVCTK